MVTGDYGHTIVVIIHINTGVITMYFFAIWKVVCYSLEIFAGTQLLKIFAGMQLHVLNVFKQFI